MPLKTVCLPKGEGGLGLKQIGEWNKAATCKYLWRICSNENNTWVKWCKDQLLKGRSIWQVPIPNDVAWTWKKILSMRMYVRDQICMQVGDGRQVSLFYDCWLSRGNIESLIQDAGMIGRWGHLLVVADWWRNNQWQIPPSFERNYPDISREIREQTLQQVKDVAVWKPTGNRDFSIASCYDIIRRRAAKVLWRNLVWRKSIFPRHAFCLWLTLRRRLKTKMDIMHKGVPNDGVCVFCAHESETCEHLFFGCNFTRGIWQAILRGIGIQRQPLQWTAELNWILRKCKGRSKKAKEIGTACAAVIYELWRERNKRLFANEAREKQTIVNVIKNFLLQF